jgi:hypothetical protein
MAFKSIFSNLPNMVQEHTNEDNLMMMMLNEISKGSMFKHVQETTCVYLQHLERKFLEELDT